MADRNVSLGNQTGVNLSQKFYDPLGTGAGLVAYAAGQSGALAMEVQGPTASGTAPVGNPLFIAGYDPSAGLVRGLKVGSDGELAVNIEVGAINVGAVELKDGLNDRYAVVTATGIYCDVRHSALPDGAATEATLLLTKVNTDPLIAPAAGGFVRQDSSKSMALEAGGKLEVLASGVGFNVDTPSTDEENATARSLVSLQKGAKNYLRTMVVTGVKTDQTTHGTTDKVAADLYQGGAAVATGNAVFVQPGTGVNLDTSAVDIDNIGGAALSLGIKASAASIPVVLPNDAADVKVTLDGETIAGTVTADAGTNLNTSALALEAGGNLATVKTNTDPLVTAGGGGYVRQDSTATIAKESGGNLATLAGAVDSAKVQVVVNPYAAIGHGRKVVAASGIAEQLSADQACKEVTIVAETDNTNYVVIGGVGVIAASGTRTGLPLAAGDSVTLKVPNLNILYVNAEVPTEGVTYAYLT